MRDLHAVGFDLTIAIIIIVAIITGIDIQNKNLLDIFLSNCKNILF